MEDMNETVYDDKNEKESRREPGKAGLIIFDCRREIEVILLEGDKVTIGRNYPKAQCGIRIESAIVSRDHGVLTKERGSWWYQDSESKNGTFWNRTFLFQTDKKVRLKHGDVLRVDSRDPNEHHEDSVIIIFSERCRKDDRWNGCRLKPGSTIIGRDEEESKIVLNDVHVSRTHAEIKSDSNGQYWIQDLDSCNGTFVNGTEVKTRRRLQDKDVIMICGIQLIFEDNTILYSSKKTSGVQMRVDIDKKETPGILRKTTLLKDIHLSFESGDFVTILGDSGVGKSTLFKCMNGFEQKGVHGQICINGIDLYKNYKKMKMMLGYVQQKDDKLPDDLTAYELVYSSAQLRVSWLSSKELKLRVEQVLEELGILSKKDVLIWKLSGGEKRRVSFAMQLVADPMIIFMDEITSGLDAGTELEVMELSREIAHKQNKIVLMITHNTKNFALCDKAIVLYKTEQVGRLAFFGSTKEVLRYFDVANVDEIYKKLKTKAKKYVKQ